MSDTAHCAWLDQTSKRNQSESLGYFIPALLSLLLFPSSAAIEGALGRRVSQAGSSDEPLWRLPTPASAGAVHHRPDYQAGHSMMAGLSPYPCQCLRLCPRAHSQKLELSPRSHPFGWVGQKVGQHCLLLLPRSRFGPALWLDSTTTATALGPSWPFP